MLFFFLLRMLNFAETVRMLIRQARIGNILLQKEELLIQMPLPNSVGGKAEKLTLLLNMLSLRLNWPFI